ncbi:MAG: PEP-utilizing enzyme [archaeon]|jgi:pyruvate,water dikinase
MEILLKGTIASKGIAKGKCIIVNTLDDFSKVNDGDIIVVRNTDPSYLKLFSKISGIITEIGGLCSHAGIIAREFGMPCIVGTGNARELLKNHDIIVLDANKGIVYEPKENE